MLSPLMRSIRGQLAELGLSQHDLAAALGISQSTLNAMLNGRRPARAGFEAQAAEALDRLERVELAAAEAREQAVAGRRGVGREQEEVAADGDMDPLPEVLFLEDVAALLRCSPSTIKRRLRAHIFPVAPIQGIDKRPRWSKAAVLQWLAVDGRSASPTGRRRRTG